MLTNASMASCCVHRRLAVQDRHLSWILGSSHSDLHSPSPVLMDGHLPDNILSMTVEHFSLCDMKKMSSPS